ncbi:MAG: hypothetical protein F6J90_34880 [Moorea sp. SIOASIH]|uniref:hypothetical protein n=1 Tax=Moorena sp. SIOASIH TaxID=2607817 RepID=UPI0013BA4364|nr:hypothetical protein [Moorena sp. SIOASIH]NEO41235.1 hypothetical protein [Moorena sp. SIOASIH]
MVTTPTNDRQLVALSLVVNVREKCAASPTSLYNIVLMQSLMGETAKTVMVRFP